MPLPGPTKPNHFSGIARTHPRNYGRRSDLGHASDNPHHPEISGTVVPHLEKLGVLGCWFEHFKRSHDPERGRAFEGTDKCGRAVEEVRRLCPPLHLRRVQEENRRSEGLSWFEGRRADRVLQRTVVPGLPGSGSRRCSAQGDRHRCKSCPPAGGSRLQIDSAGSNLVSPNCPRNQASLRNSHASVSTMSSSR